MVLLAIGMAQDVVIESFTHQGELRCAGLFPGSTADVRRVSGAPPRANGWETVASPRADTSGVITVVLPLVEPVAFYRVEGLPAPDKTEGMMFITAGSFQMGDNLADVGGDETPVHPVTCSAFLVDKAEVTNEEMANVLQWAYEQVPPLIRTVMSGEMAMVRNTQGRERDLFHLGSDNCGVAWNGSRFVPKTTYDAKRPCVEVTWDGAVGYCRFLSLKEGRTPCYVFEETNRCNWAANGYRLPTEAEWEYAARGGVAGLRFPWGMSITHDHANYRAYGTAYTYDTTSYRFPTYHPEFKTDDQPYTAPVGSLPPNGYGLFDMIGNVWEWCWDWYDAGYYTTSPETDPRGPLTDPLNGRSQRGGSWDSQAVACRVARRQGRGRDASTYNTGFRTVRRVEP